MPGCRRCRSAARIVPARLHAQPGYEIQHGALESLRWYAAIDGRGQALSVFPGPVF